MQAELDTPAASRLTPGAEVAGYLGGTLALAAALALGAQLWPRLEPWAQVAVLALGAGALLAAGAWARRGADDSGVDRLSGVLWLLAVLPAAGAFGVAASDLIGWEGAAVAFPTALLTTALASGLWLLRPGALQLIAVHAGLVATVLSGLSLAERPPWELFGLAVWAVGLAGGLLAWGGVTRPRRTGLALGAATAAVGAQALVVEHTAPALVLGLCTAAVLVALARPLGEPLLAGVGVIGLAAFAPQLLNHWFPDSVGPAAALFVGGVVLLVGALATIRSGRDLAA